MKTISNALKPSLPLSRRIPLRALYLVKRLLSSRILLLVAFCALIALAISSETDVMRAQQSSTRAIVRHGFTTNGRIEGSVQQLMAENSTLNSSGVITGDLLVPGTPTVQVNGSPNFGGTVQGTGSAQPTNYQVTINGGAQLGHLVRRTDPITMPTVAAPPASTGTRDVTLNNASQSPGDFATLRDLTLNSAAGIRTVPAGTYRKFVANGGTGFILGVAGATEPAVYNFNSLLLNGGSQIQVVGPIVVTTATAVTLNAPMGSVNNPLWLSLKVAVGGLTLNGGSAVYGVVTAPSGQVTINSNSSLIGNVICDRLTTNGTGLLRVLQQQSDTTPPNLTVQQPTEGAVTNAAQVSVTGTFSDASQTTITANGVVATLSGNSFTASVPVAEGNNTVLVVATDAAGNHTDVTRHVVRDSSAPAIVVQQPSEGTVTNGTQVQVTGTISDATTTAVTINGAPATLTGNSFSVSVQLSEGANAIQIQATDGAGNQSNVTRNVNRDTVAPALTISSPETETVTSGTQITVMGTFTDATPVNVTVNGTAATVFGNSFSASVAVTEGANSIQIIATDAATNQSQQSLTITSDTTQPVITLTAPAEGSVSKTVVVAGHVTDGSIVSVFVNQTPVAVDGSGDFSTEFQTDDGPYQIRIIASDVVDNSIEVVRNVTVDSTPPVISNLTPAAGTIVDSPTTIVGHITDLTTVSVQVNGVNATVDSGGDFSASIDTATEGENGVNVVATDAAGNQETSALILAGRDRTAPAAPVVQPVTSPTRLNFQTIQGRAESGARVQVSNGGEIVEGSAAVGTGVFAAMINLNDGENTLFVTAFDSEGNASPTVQVLISQDSNLSLPPAGEAAQINISTGDAQRGLTNHELPRPFIALVTDRDGHPVSGATVNFTVQHGGGTLIGGGSSLQATTDQYGHASARYLAGPVAGPQLIRADFPGNAATPSIFLAETMTPGTGPTIVSGIVLDQNMRGLPNVLVRMGGQETRTQADGRFAVANVVSGPHQLLELIGRDQIPFPGRWPNITFDYDVLPGVENQLGRPLFLPRVNDGIAMPLDGNNVVTQDTTFELRVVGGEAPVRITAKAGTKVIFPPDVTDKRLSVTRIPADRIPMGLEDGLATNLYVSVQPSGAVFETPLEVSFPNLDQLAPESEVLLMSFDHDAGRYIRVGTGHVSADGRSVVSDPGSGIRVGAWHGAPPPNPEPEAVVLSHVKVKDNPLFEGAAVVNSETFVLEKAATMLTAREEMATADQWDFWANVKLPNNGAVQAKAVNKTKTTTLKIRQVTFDGDQYLPVAQDNGVFYSPGSPREPHWKDESCATKCDGKASETGDSRFPVAFVRSTDTANSFIKVSATFVLADVILPTEVKVIGDGPGDLDFEATATTEDEAGKSILKIENIQAKNPLLKTIKFYNSLEIQWKYSFDKNAAFADVKKFKAAGKTDNRVYVTFATPTSPTLYESLLDISCRNADGKTTEPDAVAAIWLDFAGPSPGVKRKKKDGKNVDDGREMKYWATAGTPEAALAGSVCQTYHAMLNTAPSNAALNGVGTCAAWSQLLHQTIKAQGISGTEIYELQADTTVNVNAGAFMVKKWKFEKHLRTGPNGINNSPVVGDDVPIINPGTGLPNILAIGPGPNGTLETTPSGDDQAVDQTVGGVVLKFINTGADGVCNTNKVGDDEQPSIQKDKGAPNTPAIAPGPNGVLDSAKLSDDMFGDGIFNLTLPAYPYIVLSDPTVDKPPDEKGQLFGDVSNRPGVPGQGVAEPPPYFFNHFIVKYTPVAASPPPPPAPPPAAPASKFYDPSYGAGFDSFLEHEKASIDGIIGLVMFNGERTLIGRKNNPNPTTAELTYVRKIALE